jgi:hypothetical protein
LQNTDAKLNWLGQEVPLMLEDNQILIFVNHIKDIEEVEAFLRAFLGH